MTALPSSPRVRTAALGLIIAVLGVGIGYALAQFGHSPSHPAAAPTEGRKILYWYDPMVPAERHPGPGKSSMNMELIPKYADERPASAGVAIDPRQTQNLGVRLATVRIGALAQTIELPGVVEFNERDIAIVQSRSAGFVERTYRRAPGDVVAAGAPLADLYVPDWSRAQTEYLALRRTGDDRLADAGLQRLRLAGMPPSLITQVERTGKAHAVTTVRSPVSGVVQTLKVRPGMTLSQGETLAEINGLSTVWISAAAPEAQAGLIQAGQTTTAELAAYPGELFTGRVTAVLPQARSESRTLEVRIELPNRGGRLRPGMFATVHLASGGQRPVLLIPSEAVIRTGRRTIVMLAFEGGRFRPAEVRLGSESGGQTEILAGLREGERVVASGQFLLESEASLADLHPRPVDAANGPAPAGKSGRTGLQQEHP